MSSQPFPDPSQNGIEKPTMTDPSSTNASPIDLPSYLFARREALLHMWRTACVNDPSLHIGPGLSQEEFNDQIPTILNLFEEQLRGKAHTTDLNLIASEHGLHRWHKGYSLRELLAELSHFNQCLAAEITAYKALHPTVDPSIITRAYEQVVQFGSKTVSCSVVQYDELQRGQAIERTEVLQQALDQITDLTRQRGEFLRMTSHDLRGSLGVIQGAAALLKRSEGDSDQSDHLDMLRRNLLTTGAMLAQLTDLSRLEAGQETVKIQSVDASVLLRSIVDSVQPMAKERGLALRADGPDSLPVQTDAVMIQRIVQNLLLNALQHTPSGLISVSWSSEDNFRWLISVQDTGSGLPSRLVAALSKPLKPTLESSSVYEKVVPDQPFAQEASTGQSSGKSVGEGIGLYIVKLLCQLLNASIDIETRPGQGTLFRVRLMVHGEQDDD